MSLPRLKLSPNGPEFSRLVYGTWRVLDDGASLQDLNRRLNRCADLGMTTLDTAEIYGLYEVEEALGKALALSPGLRDRLEIVTKAGIYVPNKYHPERRTAFYNATGARLIKSLEKSLRFLGTDRVDLFLVHRPDWLTSADDTASGLNQLVREGKIASAGVSNYSVTQYDLLNSRLEQPLVTNQVEFHLLHMDPVYDACSTSARSFRCAPWRGATRRWPPL
ncbi:aldo/keto reductase [Verrucomicrobium spinosum]|uniref:aldo/keto reductase n=1 Tax=Verrucomicrobium spinosum TaxID=2736 RepID=UPI0009EC8296|nr:aldo/keto reductase [Verrucomicrobium spinosum]